MEAAALSSDPTAPQGSESPSVSRLLELGRAAYQLAVHLLGSDQGADDVVQQAYLQALKQIGAGGEPREERPWFLRIVANAAKDSRKREARRRRREADVQRIDRGEAKPREELVASLRRELWAMDEKYRVPIALCYEQGLSQREAAAVLDIPVPPNNPSPLEIIELRALAFDPAVELAGAPAATSSAASGSRS